MSRWFFFCCCLGSLVSLWPAGGWAGMSKMASITCLVPWHRWLESWDRSLFKWSLLNTVAESPDLPFPRRKEQKHHLFLVLLIKADRVPVSPDSKWGEIYSISQWEKWHRICNYLQFTLQTCILIIIATLKGGYYLIHFIKEKILTVYMSDS